MENQVPFAGVAFGLWLVSVPVSAIIVRRALFAFLFGTLFTAAFVGYCMYYAGPVEGGGLIHALLGGIYGVLIFHLTQWLRSRLHRSSLKVQPPNPQSGATGRQPSSLDTNSTPVAAASRRSL
jgi:ABC-type thiamin/hydroxymethylpyrimidine transport system permease subunit